MSYFFLLSVCPIFFFCLYVLSSPYVLFSMPYPTQLSVYPILLSVCPCLYLCPILSICLCLYVLSSLYVFAFMSHPNLMSLCHILCLCSCLYVLTLSFVFLFCSNKFLFLFPPHETLIQEIVDFFSVDEILQFLKMTLRDISDLSSLTNFLPILASKSRLALAIGRWTPFSLIQA